MKHHGSRRRFIRSITAFISGIAFFRPIMGILATDHVQDEVILPDGIKAEWDISKAFRESTGTRERFCINGLWQWQPGTSGQNDVPLNKWGYFKVPGNWPGLNHYMQRESQTLFAHSSWKKMDGRDVHTAWYQREISIPPSWKDLRIILSSEYLNSGAAVFIDGNSVGEMFFPEGRIDLTPHCKPGSTYLLSLKVEALPLNDIVAIFADTNAPRSGKGQVLRRGLCGDVFLSSQPPGSRIADVQLHTSVRKKKITFNVALEDLKKDLNYKLQFTISEEGKKVKEYTSPVFSKDDLQDAYLSCTETWLPGKLWNIHTPNNVFECKVSLLEAGSRQLDTFFIERFGFREFWIEGRDYYLNGKRIFLSSVPLDSALIGAGLANYDAAKENLKRLMSFGINMVYTHNYGCEPGTHLSYKEILRAADDTGMLLSFSQPHFGQYEWGDTDSQQKNGYAHHARFYTRAAGNHPSVVLYSMSHNGCGYSDDMNPDFIDGRTRPDTEWSARNAKRALGAEAIVAALDDSRVIYHHAGGNLGSMHTSNFYPNWVPIQEMCDWFEHWASTGEKPVFLCEFGSPFTWDWGLYRGWYQGKREFGSARVPWEFCLAEWNAQFLGDEAFEISEAERTNLRWEAKQFEAGNTWHRWDYPYSFSSSIFNERIPVLKKHLTDQWRAFRTWGVSANSPWDYGTYWQLKDNAEKKPKNLIVDWGKLQRPGFSADFSERNSRMDIDVAYSRSDWISTAGEALEKNNMPLLAYIAGKRGAFTSKDHNFLPGMKFEKQLVIINNSRKDVSCECNWTLKLPKEISGHKSVQLETGKQIRIPLEYYLPESLAPGKYSIKTLVRFSNGETQEDTFDIDVIPVTDPEKPTARIGVYDPQGQTCELLDDLGIIYDPIKPDTPLNDYELLIVGKMALNVYDEGINLEKVRKGLKVIIFEQSSEVLEQRFGFRVAEYGLRDIYIRIPDHPAMEGLVPGNLHDWKGEATLVPRRREFNKNEDLFNGAPSINWCDIPLTQIWRCGNRGNVASVLIEKPACGDFLPIVDGGYSLQYSPLMEYKEGSGMLMFCQMDVCGRTENEPAATILVRNILSYVSEWKGEEKKPAVYIGDEAGFLHLQKAGISVSRPGSESLTGDQPVIAGPGAGKLLNRRAKLLALGLDQDDFDALLPVKVTTKKEEHIASYFKPNGHESPFAGIGPADLHNRDPKEYRLIKEGAETIANGILAYEKQNKIVFCQLKPWEYNYTNGKHNVKQTYRRHSALLSRLVSNAGVDCVTPLIEHFTQPVDPARDEKRWLEGLYLDEPEEWDYPYRFFRW